MLQLGYISMGGRGAPSQLHEVAKVRNVIENNRDSGGEGMSLTVARMVREGGIVRVLGPILPHRPGECDTEG